MARHQWNIKPPTARRRVVMLVLLLAALGLGASSPTVASQPVALSGAYVGPGNMAALGQFGTWRGDPASVAVDYLGHNSWSDISEPDWLLSRWHQFTSQGGKLVLGVPMLPTNGGTLAAGATGTYNAVFQQLAQKLVAAGDGSTIIRLGWEFNGTWFPWSLRTSAADGVSPFIAYWRQIVTTMRSVPGARFEFDWSVNIGSGGIPAAQAWPGDAYVDFVGVDTYDMAWGPTGGPVTQPAARWNQIENGANGLNSWLSFARAHGKQVSLPEWGLVAAASEQGHGGGDDPLFITNMYDWIKQNQPAYESYFDAGSGVITDAAFPAAASTYRRLWGAAAPSSTTVLQTTTTSQTTDGLRAIVALGPPTVVTRRAKPPKRQRGTKRPKPRSTKRAKMRSTKRAKHRRVTRRRSRHHR